MYFNLIKVANNIFPINFAKQSTLFMNKSSEDLKLIRSMMERSSKFLSLSGLSGIGAGIIALIGAYAAHLILQEKLCISGYPIRDLFLLATITLIAAAMCGFYFSLRKARKSNSKFWMPATKEILKDFTIPMITGGLFCLIMIYHNRTVFIAPSMLIFYGLALVHVGSRTYGEIKYLGFCEIILGLLAAVFIANGLIFWTIGFGVLHIVYGALMYWKYDSKKETSKKA